MSARANGKAPLTKGAKPMPRPRAPKAPRMKPLRVEGTLIAAILDDAGEVIGEEAVAGVKLFAPFDSLPEVIEGVWPSVVESRK